MPQIDIGSIPYGENGFNVLFSTLEPILKSDSGTFWLNFSKCYKLTPSSIAILGGIRKHVKSKVKINFHWNTMNPTVLETINSCGFKDNFENKAWYNFSPEVRNSHYTPYMENTLDDEQSLSDSLREHWFHDDHVKMSVTLKNRIISKIWEIYLNAFEHSQSGGDTYTCGTYLSKEKHLKLSVVDFGVGIASSVQTFLKKPDMKAEDALKWAFTRGNSTRVLSSKQVTPGGLGLDLLREFIKVNKGKMSIYTGKLAVVIDKDNENISKLKVNIPGTVVNFSFKCDEKHYLLSQDLQNETETYFS